VQEGNAAVPFIYVNGQTIETFYHVTHNTIDFRLQEKPAKRCHEHLLCQAMLKYA